MGGLVQAHVGDLPTPLEGIAGFLGLPTFLEARVQFEWRRLLNDPVWNRAAIGGAAGRPVLLVPGFMAGEASLNPMRSWLQRLGFAVEVAPLGLNASSGTTGARVVSESIQRMADQSGERVVVVGHSRGGQHGTVSAVRAPGAVEALVTLGSPLRAVSPKSIVTRVPSSILSAVGGLFASPAEHAAEADYERDLLGPFPGEVQRTSIWSRSDGIVDWRVSMLGEGSNVEVAGSHIGLAVNPAVYKELFLVLERLVQASGEDRGRPEAA
jgi:pimeloyl-ACP methyl ester carboxylesterase